MKILAENKKAYYNYEILEKFDAGISLFGQEVKSLKERGINLAGSYVVLKQSTEGRHTEVFWIGAKIFPYQPRNIGASYNPERSRRLLLKKSEIKYLIGKSRQKGLTFIPLKIYTTRSGKIKIEFVIVKGKNKFHKSGLIRKREVGREIQRELKTRG